MTKKKQTYNEKVPMPESYEKMPMPEYILKERVMQMTVYATDLTVLTNMGRIFKWNPGEYEWEEIPSPVKGKKE